MTISAPRLQPRLNNTVSFDRSWKREATRSAESQSPRSRAVLIRLVLVSMIDSESTKGFTEAHKRLEQNVHLAPQPPVVAQGAPNIAGWGKRALDKTQSVTATTPTNRRGSVVVTWL
jgi:hypothetical protein